MVTMTSDGLGNNPVDIEDLFLGFDIETYGLSPEQVLRVKFLIDAAVNG
jgi:hypothetical protein